MKKPNPNYLKVDGEEIQYFRIDNDINGNPRYVTHFLSLGVEPADYGHIPNMPSKYRAKWFGGGYVIQSYNLESDLNHYKNVVKKYYGRQDGVK